MLRLYLFGEPRIEWQGRPWPLTDETSRALLWRLAAADRPMPGRDLSRLLWPEATPDAAARRLADTLRTLKQALPARGVILREGSLVTLTAVAIWTDVAAAAEAGPEALAALYHGAFLSPAPLPANAAYQAWVRRQRDRWARRYHQALSELVEQAAAREDHATAIAHAQRYLADNERDEKMQRRLLTLYAAIGDRRAALRQYQRCRSLLVRRHRDAVTPTSRAVLAAV